MTDIALKATDLEVVRGDKTVLSGMSFAVRQGEVFALLGGNGAGKSTTLLTFMGLLQLNRGIAEEDQSTQGRAREHIAEIRCFTKELRKHKHLCCL